MTGTGKGKSNSQPKGVRTANYDPKTSEGWGLSWMDASPPWTCVKCNWHNWDYTDEGVVEPWMRTALQHWKAGAKPQPEHLGTLKSG